MRVTKHLQSMMEFHDNNNNSIKNIKRYLDLSSIYFSEFAHTGILFYGIYLCYITIFNHFPEIHLHIFHDVTDISFLDKIIVFLEYIGQ